MKKTKKKAQARKPAAAIAESLRGHYLTDDNLSQIITSSKNVVEVMRAAYKNKAGGGCYERVAQLMKDRGLHFTNGNVYFNDNIEAKAL